MVQNAFMRATLCLVPLGCLVACGLHGQTLSFFPAVTAPNSLTNPGGLSADSSGVYIAGRKRQPLSTTQNARAYLWKFDPSGTRLWTREFEWLSRVISCRTYLPKQHGCAGGASSRVSGVRRAQDTYRTGDQKRLSLDQPHCHEIREVVFMAAVLIQMLSNALCCANLESIPET
jgi:hypothetical protein